MFRMQTSLETTSETDLEVEGKESAGEVKYKVEQDFVTATICSP
jgi:hypothetical protein